MANYVYPFIALTGGAGGALDAIAGPGLADKDMAYGSVAGYTYNYLLDADLNLAENSPWYIVPDTTPGTKVWVLQGINIGGVNRWSWAGAIANGDHIELPTITANWSGHGVVLASSSGVINESAEFEIDSTGTVQLIRGTANVVANADTASKFCIASGAAQNPAELKNNMAASKNVIIVMDWK
jgi:hypothetical protein